MSPLPARDGKCGHPLNAEESMCPQIFHQSIRTRATQDIRDDHAEYIDLVDRSGRMIRPGKRGAIDPELEPILLRIRRRSGCLA